MGSISILCNYCRASPAQHRCSKCKVLAYCSFECQVSDWRGGHRRLCVAPSASRAARDALMRSVATNMAMICVQQEVMARRVAGCMAGVKGAFTVGHSKLQKRILLPDNAIPDGSPCIVTYSSHEEENSPVSVDFIFLSPASCAQELYSLQDGLGDVDFKGIKGGLLYLFGEPSIFWSLMIHFKASQRCLPPCPMKGSWFKDTLGGKEMVRTFQSPSEIGTMTPYPTFKSVIKTKSICYTAISNAASRGMHPCFQYGDALPLSINSLPLWWLKVERIWNASIIKCRELQRAPCMFYCTQEGCLAGSSCICFHDNEWRAIVNALKP